MEMISKPPQRPGKRKKTHFTHDNDTFFRAVLKGGVRRVCVRIDAKTGDYELTLTPDDILSCLKKLIPISTQS